MKLHISPVLFIFHAFRRCVCIMLYVAADAVFSSAPAAGGQDFGVKGHNGVRSIALVDYDVRHGATSHKP